MSADVQGSVTPFCMLVKLCARRTENGHDAIEAGGGRGMNPSLDRVWRSGIRISSCPSLPRGLASAGVFLRTSSLSRITHQIFCIPSTTPTASGSTKLQAPGLLGQSRVRRCRGPGLVKHCRYHCHFTPIHRAICQPVVLALTSILRQSVTNPMFRMLTRP